MSTSAGEEQILYSHENGGDCFQRINRINPVIALGIACFDINPEIIIINAFFNPLSRNKLTF